NRLRYDYEQINNTQYFKSVDASFKPFGTKCGYVTVVWTVVEQRTGSANFGVSYSGGGQYGQGLSANISFSENNLNGTGDGVAIGSPCGGLSAGYSSRQAGVQIGFGHPVAYYTRVNFGVSATRLFQGFTANGFDQSLLDLRSALISPNNFGQNVGGTPTRTGISNLRTVTFGL